jgi:hypothetical protein
MVTPLLLALAACSFPPCTCIPGPPLRSHADVAAAVEGLAAVFEGTVVRAEYRDAARVADRLPEFEVILAVSRRWKGELTDTVTLRTPAATEACGADFAKGRTYLVFARSRAYTGIGIAPPAKPGEVVYTTKCSPTTEVGREAQRLTTLLGQPLAKSPAGRPNAPEQPG